MSLTHEPSSQIPECLVHRMALLKPVPSSRDLECLRAVDANAPNLKLKLKVPVHTVRRGFRPHASEGNSTRILFQVFLCSDGYELHHANRWMLSALCGGVGCGEVGPSSRDLECLRAVDANAPNLKLKLKVPYGFRLEFSSNACLFRSNRYDV